MILCHKCGGVLAANDADATGLYVCGCISGWVRGFEPRLDRAGAVKEQVAETESRVKLFVDQGRSEGEVGFYRERLARLVVLK